MNWTQPVEIGDVVEHLRHTFLDTSELRKHQRAGTVETFYTMLVNRVISEIAVVPIYRELKGFEPLDDPQEVTDAFNAIIDVLSLAFGKSHREVYNDLLKMVGDFPIADVRTAMILKNRNALH